ncbi:MAG: hypothetical protein LBQ77_01965 [Treponema sp.]|nr:hypothetical protein [Treponema sp.]
MYVQLKQLPKLNQLWLFCMLLLGSPWCGAEDAELPRITEWQIRDKVFLRYRRQTDVTGPRLTRDKPEQLIESLDFFSFQAVVQGERFSRLFFILSAPTSPASVATLNRLNHPLNYEDSRLLLLPTVKGIFVAEEPQNDLELLVASTRSDQGFPVTVQGNLFYFIPGADFSPDEWTLFLRYRQLIAEAQLEQRTVP